MQSWATAMLAQQGGGGGGFKVNYSPDWSLFTEGGNLAQLGLNLLAAIGLASPYDERLYRVLMRAADSAGNPAGVDAVWRELLSVLDADLELVDDELHPETIALYAALRPRGRPKPQAPRGAASGTPQD